MRRLVIGFGAVVGAVTVALALPLGSAFAAPSPTSITIQGAGLAKPLTIRAADQKETFTKLLNEVNWLATRPPNAPNQDAAKLGPKYTMLVRLDEKPDQVYDLYPYATGGPRAFRPADQPHKRKTTAAWFYGRLSMPDTLRDAGVPVITTGVQQVAGGRGGGTTSGGELAPPGTTTSTPQNQSLDEMMAQWQQGVLLTGGIAIIMVLGLAGVALLVRRY